MDIESLKQFCNSFEGANEILEGEPNNVLVYNVVDKKFAYFKTSEPEKWRFSVRVTAERFLELTDMPGIKPARYMHRFHWVTFVNVAQVESEYLKELVTWSYQRAVESLPKKQRPESASKSE